MASSESEDLFREKLLVNFINIIQAVGIFLNLLIYVVEDSEYLEMKDSILTIPFGPC